MYRTTCAELLGDGVDEAVDLFKAEDDVVMMGGMSASFLPLVVTCEAHSLLVRVSNG